jgi:glucose-1-phosphate thymidylyltransferase
MMDRESVALMELEVIGLIPAAGQATRISPLPGSKELYPIGFYAAGEEKSPRPKVVCQYLLERMHHAGIAKAYLILRSGKWDIPAYFGDGAMLNMNLGYLIMGLPFGVAYTLDQAYPFVKDSLVALGFPDILFQPEDSYKHMLNRLRNSSADVVLSVVPLDQPHKGGMVDFDANGLVHSVIEKPTQSESRHSWCNAVWKPSFTAFMHQYLAELDPALFRDSPQPATMPQTAKKRELPIGDVFHAAIAYGLRVEAEVFPSGKFLDIGTPEDLAKAVRYFALQELDTPGFPL